MIAVSVVTPADDLADLVRQINQATWDDANEMSPYDVASLAAYLRHPDTFFLACHAEEGSDRTLLGIASARLEPKPYGGERWLYVDEIDVVADHRRRGAGRVMMKRLIGMATELGCTEVWLGAEAENDAANALYLALGPTEVADVKGYTYLTGN